jgi:hypothetical protein
VSWVVDSGRASRESSLRPSLLSETDRQMVYVEMHARAGELECSVCLGLLMIWTFSGRKLLVELDIAHTPRL